MKKWMRLLCAALICAVLLPVLCRQQVKALEPVNLEACYAKLDNVIEKGPTREERLEYVKFMLRNYLQQDDTVRQALDQGKLAVFMFDGCSDLADGVEDITEFRNTGLVLVLKMENGVPKLLYTCERCSSIPDRPMEFTAPNDIPDKVAEKQLGPATLRDGSYRIVSTYHGTDGTAREALQVRMPDGDNLIRNAMYLTPNADGTVSHRNYFANGINIHSRRGWKTSGTGPWSAGCQLVENSWGDFKKFMDHTYRELYADGFATERLVGSYTVNRVMLRDKMANLYGGQENVDELLKDSDWYGMPGYLGLCEFYPSGCMLEITQPSILMSLPAPAWTVEAETDSEETSRELKHVKVGEKFTAARLCRNTEGNLWYEIMTNEGDLAYLPSDRVKFCHLWSEFLYAKDDRLQNISGPGTLHRGDVFCITGAVSTRQEYIQSISAGVYPQGNKSGNDPLTIGTDQVNGRFYNLSSSPIDAAVEFNLLEPGSYVYAIACDVIHYYAEDNNFTQMKEPQVERLYVFKQDFEVLP